MILAAKKKMDFTLNLEVNENSGSTIVPNVYECFRILGDAILISKGIKSDDHLLPIKEIAKLQINSLRPISIVENLRSLRHKINYYGPDPTNAEVQDSISFAKECFYKAYEKIKSDLEKD
jgi:uncharacterized protein (UPF0332 family)